MNIPSFLLNRKTRGLADDATRGLLAGVPPHVSIAGNKFTLVDAAGNEKSVGYLHEGELSLDVVIVYANPNVSKVYYDRPYDPNDSGPPECWSDNGQSPSAQASEPQNALCSTCPRNAWGSATSKVTGKQTKACQDSKKLAVLVPAFGGEMPFMLKVPPNSLKNMNAYVRKIAAWDLGGRKADPSDIITRVSFESQGTIKFTEVSLIDEQIFGYVAALDAPEAEAKLDQIVGKLDQPRAPQIEGPKPRQGLPPQVPPQTPPELPPFIPQVSSAQAEPDAPRRGRGRPPKTAEAPAQAPLAADEIPSFLNRSPSAAPAPVQQASAPTFGIVQTPAAPSAELQSALDAVFKIGG